jgi:hypothetical protein
MDAAVVLISISEKERLSLTLHDVLGRKVAVLRTLEDFDTGTHTFPVRLDGLRPGVYFLHLQGARCDIVRKIVVQ